eukprot:g26.t1
MNMPRRPRPGARLLKTMRPSAARMLAAPPDERLASIEAIKFDDNQNEDTVSDAMRAGMRELLEAHSAYELHALCRALEVRTAPPRAKGERRRPFNKLELVDAIVAQKLGARAVQSDFWDALQPMWESTLVEYLRQRDDPRAESTRVDPRHSVMVRWKRARIAPPPALIPAFMPRTVHPAAGARREGLQCGARQAAWAAGGVSGGFAKRLAPALAARDAIASSAALCSAFSAAAPVTAAAPPAAAPAAPAASRVLAGAAKPAGLAQLPHPAAFSTTTRVQPGEEQPGRSQPARGACQDARVLALLRAIAREEDALKAQERVVRDTSDPDEMLEFLQCVGRMRAVEKAGRRYLLQRARTAVGMREHAEGAAAQIERRLRALARGGRACGGSTLSGDADTAGRATAQQQLWLSVAARGAAGSVRLLTSAGPRKARMLQDLARLQSQCARAQRALLRSRRAVAAREQTRDELLRRLERLRDAHALTGLKLEELGARAATFGASDEASTDGVLELAAAEARRCADARARLRAAAPLLLRMLRARPPGGGAKGKAAERERAAAALERQQAAVLLEDLHLLRGDALAEQQERVAMWQDELTQRRAAALAEAKAAKKKRKGNGRRKRRKKRKLARRKRLDRLRKRALARKKKAERKAKAKAAKLLAKERERERIAAEKAQQQQEPLMGAENAPADIAVRYARMPTAVEFERITSANTPVIFSNAWNMFGPRVAQWRDRAYLLEHFGSVRNPTSLFDIDRKKDPGDRFTTRPVRKKRGTGYNLVLPYKEDWTIRKLVESEWRETRALAFAEQADALNIDSFVTDPPAGQPCESPVSEPRLWADVGPLAPFLRESFAEVMHFNLWLGKIPNAPDGRHPGRRSGGGAGPIPGRFVKEAALHHDPNDNLLLQLSGNKTVWMYGMADWERMYPQEMPQFDKLNPFDRHGKLAVPRISEVTAGSAGSAHETRNNFSPLNPHAPDYEALPLAKGARLKKCELRPGDALYMPALTWHDVISTPDAQELNVAANAWMWAKCGSKSPYKRVSLAACARYVDEVDRPGFTDGTSVMIDIHGSAGDEWEEAEEKQEQQQQQYTQQQVDQVDQVVDDDDHDDSERRDGSGDD